MSDGTDNASQVPMDEVLEQLRASTASVYTIGIYDELSSDRNPKVLRSIARLGAGRSYFPDSQDDLLQAWSEIAARIRSEYTIAYQPANPVHDGQYRTVRITATGDRGRALRVTARDGYCSRGEVRGTTSGVARTVAVGVRHRGSWMGSGS